MTTTKTRTIDALIVEPGRQPRRARIADTLETLQHLVDGYIEPIGLGHGVTGYVNEEGKIREDMRPNRILRIGDDGAWPSRTGRPRDIIMGTLVITGFNPGTGRNTSLTDEQADRYARIFAL